MATDERRFPPSLLGPSTERRSLRIPAGLLSVTLLAIGSSTVAHASTPSLDHLRCEYKVDPIGIDSPQPRLSWQLRSHERGVVQTAYRVQVALDRGAWEEEAILWDTRKVVSSHQRTGRWASCGGIALARGDSSLKLMMMSGPCS